MTLVATRLSPNTMRLLTVIHSFPPKNEPAAQRPFFLVEILRTRVNSKCIAKTEAVPQNVC